MGILLNKKKERIAARKAARLAREEVITTATAPRVHRVSGLNSLQPASHQKAKLAPFTAKPTSDRYSGGNKGYGCSPLRADLKDSRTNDHNYAGVSEELLEVILYSGRRERLERLPQRRAIQAQLSGMVTDPRITIQQSRDKARDLLNAKSRIKCDTLEALSWEEAKNVDLKRVKESNRLHLLTSTRQSEAPAFGTELTKEKDGVVLVKKVTTLKPPKQDMKGGQGHGKGQHGVRITLDSKISNGEAKKAKQSRRKASLKGGK